MKITNQNVPPELLAKYRKLVSSNATGEGAGSTARTRRAVRATKPKRQQDRGIEQYRSAAAFVADMLIAAGEKINRADFIGQEMRRLLAGEFSPDYWKECDVLDTTSLESLPSSVNRDFIPSYIYPDETMQPTTPTYPDGVIASGLPAYEGVLVGDRFTDQRLTWQRTIFDIVEDANGKNATPLFLHVAGTVSIQATDRTCKAFRAFCYKVMICGDSSPWLDDSVAPVVGVSTVWPRVKTGETPPPYYTAQQQVSVSARVDQLKKWREPLTSTRAVVHVAPRALMGKWYNNNSSVSLTLDAATRLLRPFLPLWDVRAVPGWAQQINVYFVHVGGKLWLISWGQSVATEDGRTWGQMAVHENLQDFGQPAGAGNVLVSWFGDMYAFTMNPTTGELLYPWSTPMWGVSQMQDGAAVVQSDFNRLIGTQDGVSWSTINSNWPYGPNSFHWAKDRYFIAEGGGRILVSFDLINWSPVFFHQHFYDLKGAGYFNGEYYFWQVYSGVWWVYASSDLVNFRQVELPAVGGKMGFFVFPDCIELWYFLRHPHYSLNGVDWITDNESPVGGLVRAEWKNNRAVYYLGSNTFATRRRRA